MICMWIWCIPESSNFQSSRATPYPFSVVTQISWVTSPSALIGQWKPHNRTPLLQQRRQRAPLTVQSDATKNVSIWTIFTQRLHVTGISIPIFTINLGKPKMYNIRYKCVPYTEHTGEATSSSYTWTQTTLASRKVWISSKRLGWSEQDDLTFSAYLSIVFLWTSKPPAIRKCLNPQTSPEVRVLGVLNVYSHGIWWILDV